MSEKVIVGIDLGTTYLCTFFYNINQQKQEILTIDGLKYIPSTLSFNKQGKPVVGAKMDDCFSEVKRFIGMKFSDPSVQQDIKMFPQGVVVEGPNDTILLKMEFFKKEYVLTPEDVTAMLLIHLKNNLLKKIGNNSTEIHTVVTVPSNFTDSQINATQKAIKMAGLKLIQTEREPTAAAFAFDCEQQIKRGKIMVFDFGGGTLDLSIVDKSFDRFDVKIPHGDNHFGGIDVDKIITDEILDKLEEENDEDFNRIFGAEVKKPIKEKRISKLRKQAEKIKKELCLLKSEESTYSFNFSFISSEFEEVELMISRKEFDEWLDVIYQQSIELVYECLETNNIEKMEITKLLLVGGSSLIPGLKEKLRKEFNNIDDSMDPNEAIALGALKLAQSRMNQRDGIMLPTERTCYPIKIKQTIGNEVKLVDVVKKGTLIPFSITIPAKTDRNNQTSVEIEVFENDNLLNKFVVAGLPKRKRGVCKFDVVFSVNVTGKLTVSAKLTNPVGYNLQNSMTIEPTVKDMDESSLEQRKRELEAYFN